MTDSTAVTIVSAPSSPTTITLHLRLPDLPMTGPRLIECMRITSRSVQDMAELLDMDPRQVRRWRAAGGIPNRVAIWIEACAAFQAACPPPPAPRDHAVQHGQRQDDQSDHPAA